MEFTHHHAQILTLKAIEKALTEFKKPICIAICDKFGFLLTFTRMENAPVRSIEISISKAYTAARMTINTDQFLATIHKDNLSPSFFCDNKLTALPGGSILKDEMGNIIGAVGVSGLKTNEDQLIANMMAEQLIKRN